MTKVVTRFAPSPTGHLHIGGARTAIFCWLLARHFKGEFCLRIEDTDTERSKQEYTDSILASMKWLGLDWDRELIYQTQRTKRYKEAIATMLANGTAYYCDCTIEEVEKMRETAQEKGEKPRYNGKCRELGKQSSPQSVVRLKVPASGKIILDDMVKGRIVTDVTELDDMVLQRSDGMPTYNLAVVVDDHDMGISHVIRGDDHVANTPKQILIYNALGWDLPVFGHVPMILGADGQKLSKRNGARAVVDYQQDGLLPQALVNYLVRLGWSAGDSEVFSLEELIELFDGTHLNSSPARIDPAKLDWLNAQYIKEADNHYLAQFVMPLLQECALPLSEEKVELALGLFKERVNNTNDLAKSCSVLFTESSKLEYEEKALKSVKEESKKILADLRSAFSEISDFTSENIDKIIHAYVEEKGLKFKEVGPILRCALTGQSGGPSLALLAHALGKEESLKRIDFLLKK